MLHGTDQDFGRPGNGRTVLEAIRLGAPVTRAASVKRVSLTVQPVSTSVRELEIQGLLIARRGRPVGRGSPALSLASRSAPRSVLSEAGPETVLRGAAAPAAFSHLPPRFKQMFAREAGRLEREPTMTGGGRARAA